MQNVKGATDHIMSHQNYPATKAQLVAECNGLSEFSEEDKKAFAENLPDRTYNSADEVMKVLDLASPASA